MDESILKEQLVEKAICYIKRYYADEYSGHDYWHTMRVYKMAVKIAEVENADIFIVRMVALLHDVDDKKLSPKTHKKMENSVCFLRENNVSEDIIMKICNIISQISYKGKESSAPDTIEGKCVQDADRLDALGAIGIARIFAYGGNNNRPMYDPDIKPNVDMSADEYALEQTTSINHFYEKIFNLKEMMNTQTAKDIAKQREEYMKDYLNEFFSEWNIV